MSDGLHFRGTYHLRLLRGGHLVREEVAENTLTWQGVTHLLRAGLLSREWVIAFKAGGEGSADDTSSARPWHIVPGAPTANWVPTFGAGTVTNASARMVVAADFVTDGICIQSGTGDVLLSVAEWYADQEMYAGDEFEITYSLDVAL